MPHFVAQLVRRKRQKRWANLFVANLRILLAFALVPSGLKKVLNQPFTDPTQTGAFHEFLHAFHATGTFYQFVGSMQLLAAVLLLTQRYASLGAAMLLPIFSVILVFCWSTWVPITASFVTLMWLGTVLLVVWDVHKWRGLVAPDSPESTLTVAPIGPVIDVGLWRMCGLGILALYLLVCLVDGGIYRPRGAEWDNPKFYVFPVIVAFPIVTWWVDRARHRRRSS